MPTLSRKSYETYLDLLSKIEESAVDGFASSINRTSRLFMAAKDEDSRSVFRSYIADIVYGRIDVARSQAEARADDMFEAMVGEKPSSHDSFPYEAADRRVRSAAVHLFEDADVDGFASVLETFIREEVRGAASMAIAENVEEANKR